jgi:hypothetical protein
MYDNSTGRWFAAIQDITTDSIHLAVSTTDDPQGNWTVYNFPFSDCPDQPGMAVSNDKLVISVNDFTEHCNRGGTFSGTQYTVVDKNDLLTAYPAPRFWQSKANISDFSVHPAEMIDAPKTSNLYMVSVVSGGSHIAKLYVLSGKAPFITLNVATIPIQTITAPEPGRQPKTPFTIDTGDARVLDAAFKDGKIWLSFNDGCRLAGDTETRSCLGLIQLDISNNRVLQDFDVGSTGSYFYYPAVTIDGAGNLDVMYGASSSTTLYPSLFVAGQTINSSPNSLNLSVNLTLGGAVERSPRYGDYFEVSDDPSRPGTFWVAGEFNPSSPFKVEYWSTFIGNFTTTTMPPSSPSSP